LKRFIIGVLLASASLFVAAGCSSSSTPNPTAAPTVVPTQTATASPAPTGATPTAVPSSTPLSQLTLVVSQPQNETVTKDSLISVAGHTSPDAIVSVNGNIVKAIDGDGNFNSVVTLVEGPNLIEVIATDLVGNQATQIITVVYAP